MDLYQIRSLFVDILSHSGVTSTVRNHARYPQQNDKSNHFTRWWFDLFFFLNFIPIWGRFPCLTHIFQRGLKTTNEFKTFCIPVCLTIWIPETSFDIQFNSCPDFLDVRGCPDVLEDVM